MSPIKKKKRKNNALWEILFFKENKDVSLELDEQVWKRTQLYMYTAATLVALWGVFDIFIDFENLWIFLTLRAIYTPLTLLSAYYFHRKFFNKNHKAWAMIHYLLLIIDIGIMVLWTDNFVKYLIGFSTIFWGASAMMLWRFWNTIIPGIIVILIAVIRFTYFPHNVATDEFITGSYYFLTCLSFAGVISAYGYWSAYQLTERSLALSKTQEKLIQAEKTASLNTVVASVAHEINTPIGTAITASSHAEEEFKAILNALKLGEVSIDQLEIPARDGITSITSALSELRRTAKLVEQLKDSAVDQSSYEKRLFNLYQYIDENIIHVGLKPILRKANITIVMSGDKEIMIDSYPGEFSQIFSNLILNTIHHGYHSHNVAETNKIIHINIGKSAQNIIKIEYSDDGHGMSEDVLNKVFDPFFTTKGTDSSHEGRGHKGSGLGMSIVYNSITQKLNGHIEVKSQINMGVLFTIKIPYDTDIKNAIGSIR